MYNVITFIWEYILVSNGKIQQSKTANYFFISLNTLFVLSLFSSICCFFVETYFNIHLFLYFWLSWVFIASRGLSVVSESGGYPLVALCRPHRSGFYCCRAWAVGHRGFSSCYVRTKLLQLAGSRVQA